MINTSNIEKFKQILKNEKEPKIVMAQDDSFNRKALEYGKFNVLLGIENLSRKMNLRNLDSGLNPFLASLAAKNKIALGIDLDKLRNLDKKEKSIILAQISQNIKLCRKEGVKIALFGVKDRKDAFALIQELGGSTQQVKEALAF